MINLYKKELGYYLNSAMGYLIVVLFAVFANFLFVKDIFISSSSSMRPFFGLIPWLLMVFIPALTMRILSEEKRTNTIEVLLTLPVSETRVILAKFLSLLTIMIISFVLTLGLPISLMLVTKIYLTEVVTGYLGVMLLSASFISIAIFFSSQTKNQVFAFLTSFIAIFFLIVLSTDFLASVLPKFIQDATSYFSPIYHLQNFVKGVIDMRSVFYFLSLTAVFLFLSIVNLEKRN